MEDSTNHAQQRLAEAEEELAALDGTQEAKRMTLTEQQKQLSQAKETIASLQSEEKEVSQREESLGQQHKSLLVSLTYRG